MNNLIKEKTATKPKVLAVVGPTASGKSDLAVELAHKFNGEVISADSRQVYKGFNLASGKVPGRWRISGIKRIYAYQDIRHHLIDVVSPRKRFTVQKFKKKAQKEIVSISSRGKLPIMAGGTGFYVDTVLYDVEIPQVPPNKRLRAELEELSNEQLLNRLSALDPVRAKNIDVNNRRRVIRAIEIVVSSHSPVPEIELFNTKDSPYEILKIGIKLSDEELRRRIKSRLRHRLDEGMVEEIRKAHLLRTSWKRLEDLGLEFKYVAYHLQGIISYEEMQENIINQSWQFAKRQMTWFKRDPNTIWIDVPAKASQLAQDFLSHGASPSSDQQET